MPRNPHPRLPPFPQRKEAQDLSNMLILKALRFTSANRFDDEYLRPVCGPDYAASIRATFLVALVTHRTITGAALQAFFV